MEFINKVLSKENMTQAFKQVTKNKGAAGLDNITVDEAQNYVNNHWEDIKGKILNKKYFPSPVKRIYIPKNNGDKRPLGIPTVMDRIIQQAIAQQLELIYEPVFSDSSYGFRPGRSCEKAIIKTLEIINDGYDWIIDLDISKFFDTVNHDKLIQLLRKRMNDDKSLFLIRQYLKAGYFENGNVESSVIGTPQGSNLSPILSNIMLDEFDKELESRGLNFVRYADDSNIFLKSGKAANRVMKSITSWLERKLFLKVNATKTKVVKPNQSNFLGFTYFHSGDSWKVKPTNESKEKLVRKLNLILCRRKAAARTLAFTFSRLNQVLRGWINYFKIGYCKTFLTSLGRRIRHKVRVVIVKQWKKTLRIYKNLRKLGTNHDKAYQFANSHYSIYKRCSLNTINYAISPKRLEMANKKTKRPGLINPVNYYVNRFVLN